MSTGNAGDEPGTVTWGELLAEAESRLRGAGLESPDVDARRIVEDLSGHDGAALTLARGEAVTVGAMAAFDAAVARRETGEPLQYVLGHWGFRTLDLLVDGRVLIPRPETESVVEVALTYVDRAGATHDGPVTVVDLGTGSGAIALSIAVERPRAQVWAADRSADAIAVVGANLAGLGRAGARVRLAEGSWFAALPTELRGEIDVIVSNPPYVADAEELPDVVAGWEPRGALRSGPDGLDDLRRIVAAAPEWLRPRGALVVELDPRQADAVVALMADAGLTAVEAHLDLAGRRRCVSGTR